MKKVLYFIVVLILAAGFGAYFLFQEATSITNLPTYDGTELLVCDAENVSSGRFVSNGIEFGNGITQTAEKAHTGQYSSKLVEGRKYGMAVAIKNLNPGDCIEASCWVYGGVGEQILCAKGDEDFKLYYDNLWEKDNINNAEEIESNNKWRKISMKLLIKGDVQNVGVRIYCTLPKGLKELYIDDLKVEKFIESKYVSPLKVNALRSLDFSIDSVEYQKLVDERKEAFKSGLLINSGNWSKGSMMFDSISSRIKLRLKGDLIDHLEKIKWSFRIKVRDNNYCDRLKVFSIQAPHTKHYLSEWVAHKICDNENVLAPRYDFVNVSVNGRGQGVYAREEHFVKQLVESKDRREGPIVKFSEEELWYEILDHEDDFSDKMIMKAAVVEAFKRKKIRKSPLLQTHFDLAQNLMYQYKNRLKSPGEVFNLEKLAKYYAIVEMTRSMHGLRWHNQRFYYDPVIGKLEPIFFDGYISPGQLYPDAPYIIERDTLEPNYYVLFSNQEFRKLFIEAGLRISSKEWLDSFYESNSAELNLYEKAIKIENPNYSYNKEFIYTNAEKFRGLLRELEEGKNFVRRNPKSFLEREEFPLSKQASLVVYQSYKDSVQLKLKAYNYHNRAIIIEGLGDEQKMIAPLKEKKKLNAYSGVDLPDTISLSFDVIGKYLYFRTAEKTDLYKTKIFKEQPPANFSAVQDMNKNELKKGKLKGVDFIEDKIIFNKGKYSLNSSIVIPKGKQLILKPGVVIDLTMGAAFISYSLVQSIGTSSLPIKVMSSDRTGKGFSVLQPRGKCEFVHTTFEGLKPLEYKGWILTGCVTIYESNVRMSNVKIINTDGEDALNLVRCQFTMDNCEIKGTKSDAFDGDFCQGIVNYVNFNNVGNDALDFSGSDIEINNVRIMKAGDKGISSGENSRLKINNVQITNANLGIASKDLSDVRAKNIKLNTVNIGFLAYQKKPEYGSAQIEVSSSTLLNVKKEHNIAPGSILILNGTRIVGNDFISSELF